MKHAERVAVVGMLMLVSFAGAQGQTLTLPDRPHYVFQHVGEELGLTTITPVDLLQDREGFIWICTQDGLIRYDGAHARRYGRAEGLPSTVVLQVVEATDGSIWAATSLGLAVGNGDSFQRVAVAAGIPPAQIQPLAADRRNHVYLATTQGLMVTAASDPAHAAFLGTSEGLPSGSVDAVFVASDDTVWLASEGRIGWLEGGNVRLLPDDIGIPKEKIVGLVQDGARRLWVRTAQHLARLDPGAGQFVIEQVALPAAGDLGHLTLDSQGNPMVPTTAGLFLYRDGVWTVLDQGRGLPSSEVVSAVQDNEGVYWIGLGGHGLERWQGGHNWSGWTKAEGLPDNVVWAELRDQKKRLWVGTSDGVGMWDPARRNWRVWRVRDGLGGSMVRSMALTPDGAVWALSYPQGLTRFDPGTLRPEKIKVPDPGPTSVLSTPDGRLLLGGPKHLKTIDYRRRPFRLQDVKIPSEISDKVSHLTVAPDGCLWAGGHGGLSRYDGKHWTSYTVHDGLLADRVEELAAPSGDEVWFLYWDSLGVTRLKLQNGKPQFTHFNKKDGLPSLNVYMLGRDREGHIWVGGDQGVARIAGDRSLRRYAHSDGLLWDDLSAGGFWEEEDGTLLFGTSGGLARFNPLEETQMTAAAPRVVITSVSLGGKLYSVGSHPTVNNSDDSLRVEFAALTYRDPARVHCWYRLGGLDQTATDTVLREVQYSALPPGHYELEVACQSASGAGSSPAKFAFVVMPAWWERWYARVSGIVLIGLLVFLWTRYRTVSLERERESLEKAIQDRSAELARANRDLREASLTDPLTGARNRRFFQLSLDTDIRHAVRQFEGSPSEPTSRNRDVIFYLIDIDHFKEINDLYGHEAGDALLVTITQRLFAVIRQSDVLIRWGGEEFLIVSRQSERSEATILAARILHAIGAEPFALKGISTTVRRSCSVGFASFPWFPEVPSAVHYEKVIEMADRALYLAKRAGRNRAVGMLPVSDAPEKIERGKQLPVDALETTHMTVFGPIVEAPVTPLRW